MMDFLGAFHPLVLHLPIGFLVAGFLVELLAWHRKEPELYTIIRFLLGLAAVTGVVSALLGYFLSQKGGYTGATFQIHQWSGFAVAVGSTLFYFGHSRITQPRWIWGGWALNLLVLTIAGHYGGSLTHGEDFLVQDAPPFIQSLLMDGPSSDSIHPDSAGVFEDVIQPIMAAKCQSCHNQKKQRGGLDLTDRSGWEKGGDSGPLVAIGAPKGSLLLQRMYLPSDHEGHMPPKGHEPIIPSEVALIEWWIASGASFDAKVSEVEQSTLVSEILTGSFEEVNPYDRLAVSPVSDKIMARIEQSGVIILPITQKSSLLEARLTGANPISEDQWNSLREAREQIVHLDLQSSTLTTEQIKRIGAFDHLIQLSLKSTNVTDELMAALPPLTHLRYLNLYGTAISDQSVADLSRFPALQQLFLAGTEVSEQSLEDLQSAHPHIDFGLIP